MGKGSSHIARLWLKVGRGPRGCAIGDARGLEIGDARHIAEKRKKVTVNRSKKLISFNETTQTLAIFPQSA